jgi:DNA-3-methyladenine glycosylase II
MTDLKLSYQFELSAKPPYSFDLSVHKPAGWWWATPDEIWLDKVLWTTIRFDDHLIGLKLWEKRKDESPSIHCSVYSDFERSGEHKNRLKDLLKRSLRLDENLGEFYRIAENDDILKIVVNDLRGMRIAGWPDLFPALILAVTLQMAPFNRSQSMMNLLITNYGDMASFNGKSIKYWPSAETIAKTDIEDLKRTAKLGYRAQNLKSISETLVQGFPSFDNINSMPRDEAKKKLKELRVIGDYSTNLLLSDRGFSLDVWSAKIFSLLLEGKETENPREEIPKLQRLAEERWKGWAGHAFVYILNDLANLSRKTGFDLTKY